MIKKNLLFLFFFVLISSVFTILMNEIVMPLYTKHNKERFLPVVTGLTLEQAMYVLKSEGFNPTVKEKKYSPGFDPGTVIEQYPQGKSHVKTGRRVYLTISAEEQYITMPDLMGKTIRGAELELKNSGINIDTVEYESSEMPRNVVIWQSVQPGNAIRRGSSITLIASKGSATPIYTVPNLFGLDLKKAEKIILRSGLKVGSIRFVENPDLIDFTVLEQSIPAGKQLKKPLEIDLVVSVIELTNAMERFINR